MTCYSLIKSDTDKKLENLKSNGNALSEQYARVLGIREMNVVSLLDYIKAYHGEQSYEKALELVL